MKRTQKYTEKLDGRTLHLDNMAQFFNIHIMNIPRACCTRDGDLELRREKLSSLFILAGLKLKEEENTRTYITFYLLYVYL